MITINVNSDKKSSRPERATASTIQRGVSQGTRGDKSRSADTRKGIGKGSAHTVTPSSHPKQGVKVPKEPEVHPCHRGPTVRGKGGGCVHTPLPGRRGGRSGNLAPRHLATPPQFGGGPGPDQVKRWAKIDSLLPTLFDTSRGHELEPLEVFMRGLRVARMQLRERGKSIQPIPDVVSTDRSSEPQLPTEETGEPPRLPSEREKCSEHSSGQTSLPSGSPVQPICHTCTPSTNKW
nr:putative long-distance movement protein [Carrot umbravirus 3]